MKYIGVLRDTVREPKPTTHARMSHTVRNVHGSGLPNQPRDNVTHIHTLWDNCRTRFEDTWVECGLRLPKALRAWFECRTRFTAQFTKGG